MSYFVNRFQIRLVFITVGSNGIWLALAQLVAQQGAHVWMVARRKELLESALQTLLCATGQKHGILPVDVSRWEEVQPAMERFQREVGVPDLLVNAAGVTEPGLVDEIPVETFRE